MTLNLTELKDEPLGKNPIQAMGYCIIISVVDSNTDVETGQLITPPDDMRSFSIDGDGLSDDALDHRPAEAAMFCCRCY